jgi:hypothetical protein
MKKRWTSEEDQVIKEHYPDKLATDVLLMLPDRTLLSIWHRARVMGIRKSEAFYTSGTGKRISKSNDIGKATRFKKGAITFNKGKKQTEYMTAEQIERTKATRFKKGQDPHNTVPIGTERISKDGYVEIKIRHLKDGSANNKNFVSKHRMIYEQNFGPIPKDCNVEFIDGNRLNFEPSNLILRSKNENFVKNCMSDSSIVKRFLGVKEPELVEKIITEMPEVINLKRSVLKLNKKIREDAK